MARDLKNKDRSRDWEDSDDFGSLNIQTSAV